MEISAQGHAHKEGALTGAILIIEMVTAANAHVQFLHHRGKLCHCSSVRTGLENMEQQKFHSIHQFPKQQVKHLERS